MRQRVVVQGLIQKNGKILVLRRALGAPFLEGKYELPGGQVDYKEQPEDAIKRHISIATGLETIGSLQLFDVVSYVNFDEGDDSQYVLVVYFLDAKSLSGKISLGNRHNRYHWLSLSNVQRTISLRYSAELLISILQGKEREEKATPAQSDVPTQVTIFADGGSRGNPGPSAAGFVVLDGNQHVIHEGGSFLGNANNTYAEYQALKQALEYAVKQNFTNVIIKMDSMLVVNQVNGKYAINNPDLLPINRTCLELLEGLEEYTLKYVPRNQNTLADGVVNKILDENLIGNAH